MKIGASNNHNNNLLKHLKSIKNHCFQTYTHSIRVALFSYRIAILMRLNSEIIEVAWKAGLLHDLGKIRVPVEILNKPGDLNQEEWEIIRQHPIAGLQILPQEYQLTLKNGIMYHHERWDGSGYPYGLSEENIPLIARIIAVADSLEAMSANRPYRKPVSLEEAFDEIELSKGLYDPAIIRILKTKRNSFLARR